MYHPTVMYHYIMSFHFFLTPPCFRNIFPSPIHQSHANRIELRLVSLFAIFSFFKTLKFYLFSSFLRSVFIIDGSSSGFLVKLTSVAVVRRKSYERWTRRDTSVSISVNAFSKQEVRINASPSSWWRRYPRHCVLQPSPSYWVHRVPRDLWYKRGQADFMA